MNKLSTNSIVLCRECGFVGTPSDKIIIPKTSFVSNIISFIISPLFYLGFGGEPYARRSIGREKYPFNEKRFFCPQCGYELFEEDLDLNYPIDRTATNKKFKQGQTVEWIFVLSILVYVLWRFYPLIKKLVESRF